MDMEIFHQHGYGFFDSQFKKFKDEHSSVIEKSDRVFLEHLDFLKENNSLGVDYITNTENMLRSQTDKGDQINFGNFFSLNFTPYLSFAVILEKQKKSLAGMGNLDRTIEDALFLACASDLVKEDLYKKFSEVYENNEAGSKESLIKNKIVSHFKAVDYYRAFIESYLEIDSIFRRISIFFRNAEEGHDPIVDFNKRMILNEVNFFSAEIVGRNMSAYSAADIFGSEYKEVEIRDYVPENIKTIVKGGQVYNIFNKSANNIKKCNTLIRSVVDNDQVIKKVEYIINDIKVGIDSMKKAK